MKRFILDCEATTVYDHRVCVFFLASILLMSGLYFHTIPIPLSVPHENAAFSHVCFIVQLHGLFKKSFR